MPNYSGTLSQNARPETAFTLPTGAIVPVVVQSGASLIPSGHVVCNGQALPIASYPALYALIGTSCGDGTTTTNGGNFISSGFGPGTAFNVPDLRGRFMRANDTMYTSAGRALRDNYNTSARVFISIGSPATVTHTNHHFVDNEPISFSTGAPSSGSLPAPLGIGTQYYVKYISKDTYQIRSTPNGAAINTSAGGSAGAYWCTPNSARTENALNGAALYNPGSVQQDCFQSHWHYMTVRECNGGEGSGGFAGWLADNIYWGFQGRDMIPDGSHGSPRVSSESRPVNSCIIFTIKAY